MKILDFHFQKNDKGFQLDVYSSDSPKLLGTANLRLPRSFLSEFEFNQLDFNPNDVLRVERLLRFGRELYQRTFSRAIELVWSEYKQANEFLVLRIRIAPSAKVLEAIPWETLFDGKEFIAMGAKTTISRLPLDIQPQAPLPLLPLPLRMLALVSSPLDLPLNSRLQIEREQEVLLEAINDAAAQGRISADFEDEAKLEILQACLETPYQIFHFTGHGIAPENGGGLLLEDERGKSRPSSVAEVLKPLQRREESLRLVVLSGCQTARTIDVDGFGDLARGFLRRNIPAVIAMQFSISDTGGLKFAEVLYSRIASGLHLELAIHAARRALLLSDDHYLQADALAPVLLTSNGECLSAKHVEKSPRQRPKVDFSFYLPLAQLSHRFYGRRREYRQIRDGIFQRNQRATIVHGIGGIGKTALVSHVATRIKDRFQGVYAFDCSSGTLTPETVIIKLHQYFALQDVMALEQLLYQNLAPDILATYLAQVLSQWSLLLIFDNIESHLEPTDVGFRIAEENLRMFITTLVKTTAQGSHFLFTSRYLFELDDKRLVSIQSLSLEDLSRPEALSLMQKLQHLAMASYAGKLEALNIFGGHPYALVTLDRYCNHQSLDLAFEATGNIDAELRAFLAIEINYAQLSERSRELLNRLAAFRQAVPYDAAEWVMGVRVSYAAEAFEKTRGKVPLPVDWQPSDEAKILKMLEGLLPERRQAELLPPLIKELVAWGLIIPIDEDRQPKRLYVHALVRGFCRDKQEGEIWRDRLRDASAFLRKNSTELIREEDKPPAEIWLEMEAFELLVEAEEFNDAANLLLGANALLARWGFRLYLEGQVRRLLNKLDSQGTARILHVFGNLLLSRGEYQKALESYERSLAISDQLDARLEMALTTGQVGTIHVLRGEYDKALENYEQALEVFKEFDERVNVAKLLNQIGGTHQQRGEYEKALEYYSHALTIAEDLGDRSTVARLVHNIGTIHQLRFEDEKAVGCYEQSLRIREELGDRSVADSYHQIGMIYQGQRKYEEALSYYRRSLKIAEELGSRSIVAASLVQIGMIKQAQGEYEKASEYYNQSLEIGLQLGDRSCIAISLGQMGTLLIDLGRYADALEYLWPALSISIGMQAASARSDVLQLKELRDRWGEENFHAAWRKTTGEAVPTWLIELMKL